MISIPNYTKIVTLLVVLLFSGLHVFANSTDRELNIGQENTWKVWLDKEAQWQNDTLYLPNQFKLSELKVNSPTCGWDAVYNKGIDATLPCVVEELYSKGNAKWTYHGVSWFTTTIDVPQSWKGMVVRLSVAKYNSRIEIYVNEQLAGYDIIAGTFYTCDLSKYLKAGKNRIAFRITNPGGQRGWGDFPVIKWGDFKIPPQHDFGGIGGKVKLLVTNKVFISDVFVKNLLPAKANNIEVQVSIKNETHVDQKSNLLLKIKSRKTNKVIFEKSFEVVAKANGQKVVTKQIQVSKAELWDIDTPNLYDCEVQIKNEKYTDSFSRQFGFRVFEVKANKNGEENFYLNGKRFRHKSAIDWGFYAHHGYYPSEEMARKSIANAKAIGHNGINCHRNMADPLLLDNADELGLAILGEPGGFVEDIKLFKQGKKLFIGQVMAHRCMRMALRDRNHPSVFGYILANERDIFDLLRKNLMLDMHNLDDSKLIVNQSGGDFGGAAGQIPHIRPYESKMRLDYFDDHTVGSNSRFQEEDFNSHKSPIDVNRPAAFGRIDPLKCDNIIYWGEVRCYTGPDNSFELIEQPKQLSQNRKGYDADCFHPLAPKIESYFEQNNLANTGSKVIQSPADLTVQAGRGLMYIDGRLDQIIMATNSMDGFAINGWSGGANILPDGNGKFLQWYSSIVDEGRNLKGPADDYNYWNRPLQVVLFRKNGKYFNANDTLKIEVGLINEGLLKKGKYELQISLKDGDGKYTDFQLSKKIEIDGNDTYAQTFLKELAIKIQDDWKAGYVTIEGKILKSKKVVATGTEQVLLQNRQSYENDLKDLDIEVINWPAAFEALAQANYVNSQTGKNILVVGTTPSNNEVSTVLEKAKNGASLIIKFDSLWAETLYRHGILKEKVTQWGGKQNGFWNGNGWGYIDHVIGDQAVPGKSTIGTTSWEVPGDPVGFAPFVSDYPQTSYGAWVARPDVLLTLVGEITYGEGKIILLPTYPVDDENAFNDLMFYTIIKQ